MSHNWHLSILSPMIQDYWEKLILLHLPAVPLISLADFFALEFHPSILPLFRQSVCVI
jgi:hypothetical protein